MKYLISILIFTIPLIFSFREPVGNPVSGNSVGETNGTASLSDPDTFPVPSNVAGLLFYIQRDPNTNTIVYELNIDERRAKILLLVNEVLIETCCN